MVKGSIALIDLDALLHIVANVQYTAGNRSNPGPVENHVLRFISTIQQSSKCEKAFMFYQGMDHTNFRNTILPEYKGHRTTSDALMTWKPTILEMFKESGAMCLTHLESDDAVSILADKYGWNKVTIISSDKDMLQVPALHYNPFKVGLSAEKRWINQNPSAALAFFWRQVLTGDSTDMPNHLCGIEGVGPTTAKKLCDVSDNYPKVIQEAYTKKYGSSEGFIRANRTYKMVRLLKLCGNDYISDAAQSEVKFLLEEHTKFEISIRNATQSLFS